MAETLSWVQGANATFRWTGSWLTVFVAADPKGAFSLSAERMGELEDLMDCVRQVGRDVYVLEPDCIDLDLRIELCLRAGYYAGQVEAAVLPALIGSEGFFAADEFACWDTAAAAQRVGGGDPERAWGFGRSRRLCCGLGRRRGGKWFDYGCWQQQRK